MQPMLEALLFWLVFWTGVIWTWAALTLVVRFSFLWLAIPFDSSSLHLAMRISLMANLLTAET